MSSLLETFPAALLAVVIGSCGHGRKGMPWEHGIAMELLLKKMLFFAVYETHFRSFMHLCCLSMCTSHCVLHVASQSQLYYIEGV